MIDKTATTQSVSTGAAIKNASPGKEDANGWCKNNCEKESFLASQDMLMQKSVGSS